MISHDHKLVFIHIPKCAGRSVSTIFNQRFDHFTAEYYFDEYPYAQSYDWFTIVRNPYDRLVSIYNYVKVHRRHRHEEIGVHRGTFKQWLLFNISEYNKSFRSSSAEGERGLDCIAGSPFWFSSQWARIAVECNENAMQCYINDKRIFKFEELDMVETFLQEQMQDPEIKLQHLNKSGHTDHWTSYYDEETYKALRTFTPLLTDLEKFGYGIM
jgi:hypothetical protein